MAYTLTRIHRKYRRKPRQSDATWSAVKMNGSSTWRQVRVKYNRFYSILSFSDGNKALVRWRDALFFLWIQFYIDLLYSTVITWLQTSAPPPCRISSKIIQFSWYKSFISLHNVVKSLNIQIRSCSDVKYARVCLCAQSGGETSTAHCCRGAVFVLIYD